MDQEILKKTEVLIDHYLQFSNKNIEPSEYLLFRQQVINELVDQRLNRNVIPEKKIQKDPDHIKTVRSKNNNIVKTKVTENVTKTTKLEDIEEDIKEDENIEEEPKSNFWEVINRIED